MEYQKLKKLRGKNKKKPVVIASAREHLNKIYIKELEGVQFLAYEDLMGAIKRQEINQ
jgi:hypothetical protein